MVQLDESQRAFIEAPVHQNIRLLAPAGCGKTLCLLHRCKYIAEQTPKSQPRFLIVTFTKSAEKVLTSRLQANDFRLIRNPNQTEIFTLNAWGLRRLTNVDKVFGAKTVTPGTYDLIMKHNLQPIWKQFPQIQNAIRRKSNRAPKTLMKMIDTYMSLCFDHLEADAETAFLNHWDELDRQGLGWHLEEQVIELIELEILDEDVVDLGSEAWRAKVFEEWYDFWCKATQHLYDSAMFTFEGQKYFAFQSERDSIAREVFLSGVTSYDHVIVDEFQDINPLDLALIGAIVERRGAKLTIAGDDDQAIYEWRGANPDYIIKPSQFFDCKEFATYTLAVNYRSPANIVHHSQLLIKHNERRESKQISSYSTRNASIEVRKTASLTEELDFVLDLVSSSVAQGEKPSQIVLVSRLQSQIIPYQIFFALNDIPFCAPRDLQILLSETFDRLLRLLEVKSLGIDDLSTRQVVHNVLFMCDFVNRFRLNTRSDRPALTRWLREARPESIIDGIDRLAAYRGELRKRKNSDGQISTAMAEAIRKFMFSETISDALLALNENFVGLQKDFAKAEEDFFFKDPPILQLADYAERYANDYDSFVDKIEFAISNLAHLPPIDDGFSEEDLSNYPLHLMTALRAKGEEYDKVVLLDVQRGIWPHKKADTRLKEEAERRVFYVAFTRAKQHVTILLRKTSDRSPFIDELELPDRAKSE